MTEEHVTLASQKQTAVVGGSVNYYLIKIDHPGGAHTLVEVEDINEVLNLSFALGCIFKACVRLCQLRRDLGKPGSTALYEAQKIKYYGFRTRAVSEKREQSITFVQKILRVLNGYRFHEAIPNRESFRITVESPRRLAPYSFIVGDFINALGATEAEGNLLYLVLAVAKMRQTFRYPLKLEKTLALTIDFIGTGLEEKEKTTQMTM